MYLKKDTKDEANYKRLHNRYSSPNEAQPYALVTGGSEGIGKEFALELARSGFNLLLVSRSQEKLDKTKKTILEQSPQIAVETATFDFSNFNPEQVKDLYKNLVIDQSRNLRILLNNVGVLGSKRLLEEDPQMLQNMIVVNIFAQTFMTKYYHLYIKERDSKLPYNLSAEAERKRYGEIHLSSFISERSSELRYIDYEIVKPSLVKTYMTGFKEHWRAVDPYEVPYGVFRALGQQREAYGAFKHICWGTITKYEPHPVRVQRLQYDGRQKN
ncbi:short chain dehydrogenase reductase family protein [Stylonychia lemnae]|uniref:Short chain dehydrogenase reductase family protein n=1 Tax=Stylonychia lemnae TaxID=5949 RepID=A0A078AXF4_STYLE|nr:short chain dehydrogenase reductase family protein [Stylonychia lemnae]|eukprot:CDW86756.1 short chain dehydrogenase reductase family protein [Stylonychia lemnae]